MDGFDVPGQPLADSGCMTSCHTGHLDEAGLSQALAIAHVAEGMDPLAAGLQAQLDAPLLQPFLH